MIGGYVDMLANGSTMYGDLFAAMGTAAMAAAAYEHGLESTESNTVSETAGEIVQIEAVVVTESSESYVPDTPSTDANDNNPTYEPDTPPTAANDNNPTYEPDTPPTAANDNNPPTAANDNTPPTADTGADVT